MSLEFLEISWVTFNEISWVTFNELCSRAWIIMGKRLCIYIYNIRRYWELVASFLALTNYVPVVALSINDDIKPSEHVRDWFKIMISWNKYRSEITTQPINNDLDHMIDQYLYTNYLII